jgi:hypothetical protein
MADDEGASSMMQLHSRCPKMQDSGTQNFLYLFYSATIPFFRFVRRLQVYFSGVSVQTVLALKAAVL